MSAVIDLAAARATPHVSHSAIATYMRCPRQYEARYVSRLPPETRAASMAFGSAIHEVLAFFYTALREQRPEPGLAELVPIFEEAWAHQLDDAVPVLFDGADTAASLAATGAAVLACFLKEAPRPTEVLAVEAPFSVEVVDPETGEVLPERLVGVFDAVVRDHGTIRILEHKTAARRWTEDRLAFDLQPTAYTLAAPVLGYGDAAVTIQLLLKAKKPGFETYAVERTEQDRRDLRRVIWGVLAAIRAGAFYPVRDWQCRGCAYAGACVAG
jgi:CRISPR/Cas system-associated exonuclease Cas4 (RecB family)